MAASPRDRDVPVERDERSLGELVASATSDLSTLMRKEVELAKLEIKQEVVAAGKGAGAFGAAGFLAVLAVLFLSAGGAYGLAEWLNPWAGFLIVGGIYLVLGILAVLVGKKAVRKVRPPENTLATVKDDISWAKHPTVSPTTTRGKH
jgi:hypothetical protein